MSGLTNDDAASADGARSGGGARSGDEGERIAKRIARAGLCSRRDAEVLIEQRRVTVDGAVVETPALKVRDGDAIAVDGKPLPGGGRTRLFRLHKPRGVLTAARDPSGRRVIGDLLPNDAPRLMPIGRLDFNSEGLLLLTNDGGLKRRLELPATGWTRRYRARAHGRLQESAIAALKKGVVVDGEKFGPIEVVVERGEGANQWLDVSLKEGRNREVRRALAHVGLQVNRLIRTAYGPFQLGSLPRSAFDELRPKAIREQLGKWLDGPVGKGR